MRIISTVLALGLFIGLAGCNTMQGAGRDIQSGGEALSNEAARTQRDM